MPRWWPWGRSKHPEPAPATPAVRPEPAWHRLPGVQRTVTDMQSTAHLEGFTASLTTSQNPGLTGPLELLAAPHPDRLTLLDVVPDPAGAAAPPSAASAVLTHRSRTWAPSPMAVQRALRQSAATVQRPADAAAPVRQIHPIETISLAEAAPHSMVEASAPDDRRMLDVAGTPDEAQPVDVIAPPPSTGQEDSAVDSVSTRATEAQVTTTQHTHLATHPLVAQRIPSLFDAAPQIVSASASGNTDSTLRPPLRQLPTVQRAATESGSAAGGLTSARPIPALRIIDSPDGVRPPAISGTTTIPADGRGTTLQRATGVGPARPVVTDRPTPEPTPTPGRPVSEGELPVIRTVNPHHHAPTPPPATAQRIAHTGAETEPQSAGGAVPVAAVTPSPLAALQRLPVVDADPAAPAAGGPERRAVPPPTVQRAPEPSADTIATSHPPADETLDISAEWVHLPRAEESAAIQPPDTVSDMRAPQRSDRPTSSTPAVQRAVQPADTPASTEAPKPPESPTPTVVQRAATAGRLVVLPPVRTSSGSHAAPANTAGAPRSILFESPRPVGLQRMFESTTRRADNATPFEPKGSAPKGAPSAPFRSADADSNDPDAAVPTFETPGPRYDAGTNTITFSSPTVQREAESAPPSPEPAPATATPTVSSAPAGPGPAPGGDVDELVNRLYDPLAARLRAELWLDRERAGVLMDLGR